MLVKDIMTKNVVTVGPEMDIISLAGLFVDKNISGAPVVDTNGKLLGVVKEEGVIFHDKKVHLPTFVNLSVGFLTFGVKRYEEEMKKIAANKVRDIMEHDITTISGSLTIEDAATLMIEKNAYYLPVVDGDKLAGVVTKKDIVRAIAGGKG
jgi:CBS domain-containing protein